MLRRTSRLVAAAFLAAAAGVALSPAPAPAAACSTASGVSVVVDFHELGGGVQQFCDTSGAGKYAAAQFGDAGHTLERVQRQPGFVCRVDAAPADDPCVNTPPADAYWGLWWSNGTSGTWTYASQGVDSLKVPAGGSVALSWNGSSTKSPPGATPPADASAAPSESSSPSSPPSPSPNPGGSSGTGTGNGNTGGGLGSTSASATPEASAGTAGAGPSAGSSAVPSDAASEDQQGMTDRNRTNSKGDKLGENGDGSDGASPAAAPTDETSAAVAATATADPPSTEEGGLPTWVGPAAVGALFVAAGGTALVRRRRGTTGS